MSISFTSVSLTCEQTASLDTALRDIREAGYNPNEIRVTTNVAYFFMRGLGHKLAPKALAAFLPNGNYDVSSLCAA